MDEVRRKVLLDIFATPGTLLPIAGGLTALMASWATGGQPILSFAGVAGVLTGLGVFASRMVLGLEKITQNAYDHVVDQQRRAQQESLEKLHERLVSDQDPRTQNCLRDLRHLYSRLKEKADKDRVTPAAYGVIEGVDKLFKSCIRQLDHSADLWETARGLKGPSRQALLRQRDDVVTEVCDAVTHLGETVERFHAMTAGENRTNLSQMRRELDESMRVAREVERRTEELTRNAQDEPGEIE